MAHGHGEGQPGEQCFGALGETAGWGRSSLCAVGRDRRRGTSADHARWGLPQTIYTGCALARHLCCTETAAAVERQVMAKIAVYRPRTTQLLMRVPLSRRRSGLRWL